MYTGIGQLGASSHALVRHHRLTYSTNIAELIKHRRLEVIELSMPNLNDCNYKNAKDGALQTICGSDTETRKTLDIIRGAKNTKILNSSSFQNRLQMITEKTLSLLLPAKYPQSVARGYLRFVSFCFVASITASTAMVLSTQTLLLAVGIVGQNTTTTSVMAGALNWVMKDFMGQLGGIIFTSQMGKTKAFDNDPKRWRMVATIALDGATMLEILSPLCHQSLVLPVASIANIGKNIGFLTASASRAALHQSLAISGNLGDVTVKAGSQSMVASLIGTCLGIGLSALFHHDTLNFGICFLCLSAIHQGCTYLSLHNVPLAYFNRNRLHLCMELFLKNQKIPSPVDVAKIERFVPFVASDSSIEWLHIGNSLREICRNPFELENHLASAQNAPYLIRLDRVKNIIDLIFLKDAKEQDLCCGMYHACLIRYKMREAAVGSTSTNTPASQVFTGTSTDRESCISGVSFDKIVRQTHLQVQQDFPQIYKHLYHQGWETSSGVTDIEDKNAHRIQIKVK